MIDLATLRASVEPSSLVAHRVAHGADTVTRYAALFGVSIIGARKALNEAAQRYELTCDAFGVYRVNEQRRTA